MGQMVTFKRPDGKDCNGYLASPAGGDKAPGVVGAGAPCERPHRDRRFPRQRPPVTTTPAGRPGFRSVAESATIRTLTR